MSAVAHINRIGTAVPPHAVHRAYCDWAAARLPSDRERAVFRRMADRGGISERWSVLPATSFDAGGFYDGDPLPSTGARMAAYAEHAPGLALAAIAALGPIGDITHLVVASCTGFVAPGIDQIIVAALGLPGSIERTAIGFMGCYAAVPALRSAHHIVRSDPAARVLVVTIELPSLHLQADRDVHSLLAMMQFGDGAAAAIVSAAPGGIALDRFFTATLPDSAELITWVIKDAGFVMMLSGEVPRRISDALTHDAALVQAIVGDDPVDSWAVHPGGRSILDAVQHGLTLPGNALDCSRGILDRNGNMSSATVLFVLQAMLAGGASARGAAMAFGPGLSAEGFRFRIAA
jgi:alpha-pyrone synthase